MNRNEQILKYITKQQRGIEIGPWFAPLAPKRDGYDCLVLDVFDTATLKARAEADPNVDRAKLSNIEDVDLVGSTTELAVIVGQDHPLHSFDYVVSSHNFEHIPNPIKFLRGCAEVLKPGGVLSMAVPDKRTCFDHFRPVSTLAGWIEAYRADRARPTAAQIFEQRSMFSEYDQHEPAHSRAGQGILQAFKDWEAGRYESPGEYIDAHCWTFTPASMALLLYDATHLGLVPFRVIEISENNGVEFYVHLENVNPQQVNEGGEYFIKRQCLLGDLSREPGTVMPVKHRARSKLAQLAQRIRPRP